MTLKCNRVLEVVEAHVRAVFHQAKCSGSCVINIALDFGQLYRLRSWISLERIKQLTSGKRRQQLRLFSRSTKAIW